MTTEKTSHKTSIMGKAAFAAAASRNEAPFKAGALFENDGVLYRVTGNNVAGLRSYFSYERVPSVALYIQHMGRFERPADPVEFIELPADVLDRIRAMAPKAAPEREEEAPACCGCPECDPDFAEVETDAAALERAATDLAAVTQHLAARGFKPGTGNTVADDVDNALETLRFRILGTEDVVDAYKESNQKMATDLIAARSVLKSYGHADSDTPLANLIDRAFDKERGIALKAADNQNKRIRALEEQLRAAQARAVDFENNLANIGRIVSGSDIIPF